MGGNDVRILLLDTDEEHTQHGTFVGEGLHCGTVAACTLDLGRQVVGEGGGVAATAALAQLTHQGESAHVLGVHVGVRVRVHLQIRAC